MESVETYPHLFRQDLCFPRLWAPFLVGERTRETKDQQRQILVQNSVVFAGKEIFRLLLGFLSRLFLLRYRWERADT